MLLLNFFIPVYMGDFGMLDDSIRNSFEHVLSWWQRVSELFNAQVRLLELLFLYQRVVNEILNKNWRNRSSESPTEFPAMSVLQYLSFTCEVPTILTLHLLRFPIACYSLNCRNYFGYILCFKLSVETALAFQGASDPICIFKWVFFVFVFLVHILAKKNAVLRRSDVR